MSSYSTLPLLLNNQTFVSMKQVNNSSINSTVLTDKNFEDYICLELAEQNDPVDLSNNEFPLPNSISIIDSSLNQSTIINNNDTVLVNERFGMKMNYINKQITSYDSWSYSVGGGQYITTTIALDPSSLSLYDSNLKIDVSLNSNTQYTDISGWAVNFDRTENNMNYFACINSYISDINSESPFSVIDNCYNIFSLGNQPNSVYNPTGPNPKYATNSYFTRDSSGIMIPQDICYNNTLDGNFCRTELAYADVSGSNAYAYQDWEFNTFKIIQDTPHVVNTIKLMSGSDVSGSAVPFQYDNGDIIASVGGLTGTGGTFDIDDIFNTTNPQWNNIGDGFQIQLKVGEFEQGGYEINSENPTNVFTLDDSNLTRDYNNLYLSIDVANTTHEIVINNGTVEPSSVNNSGNENFITIGSEAENLSQEFIGISGEIVIFTKSVDNRVYYPNDGGSNNTTSTTGNKSTLTDHVEVYYNNLEWIHRISVADTIISDEVKVTDDVTYTVSVISSSTATVELNSDNRNLDKNNSALLVVSSDISSIVIENRDYTLISNLPTDDNMIQIVSIENQQILASNEPIHNASGSHVNGSSSSVTVSHIDFEYLNYEDYRVYLITKTLTDVSNLLQLNNNWSVATTDPEYTSMIGTATKTGVIRDDYLFMTSTSDGNGQGLGLPIHMTYEFQIASPVITATQAVKHQIKLSFLDLATNTTYDDEETVFYLDDQDITLNPLDPSSIIVEDVSCTDIVNSSLNNGTYNISNYQFRKYTATRQFTASFDSKFQFYENLLFVSPLITEQSIYYQIYDLCNNQLPSYLLKYFMCSGEGHLLQNVYVSLVDGNGNPTTYSTTFDYTQEVCSIFNVELYGTTDGINYVPVPNTELSYLDPFFNFKSTITNFDGTGGIAVVNVKLNNGVVVDEAIYYIELTNAIGSNVSFLAKRYVYTVGSYDPVLNNFSYYNDFFNDPNITMTDCVITIQVDGSDNTMTVSDETGTLVTIIHSAVYVNNYNVIVCSSPLMQVQSSYNNSVNTTFYTLAVNNITAVDDGVYYFNTQNPSVGMTDTFSLVSDCFSLKFSVSPDFSNNTQYVNKTLFTESIISGPLYCANYPNGQNLTKSVDFELVRGYNSYYNGVTPFNNNSYYDLIVLNRTGTTLTFYLRNIVSSDPDQNGTTALKVFNNIYSGQSLLINDVSGEEPNPQLYDLGLVINVSKSMLSENDLLSYIIDVFVADYTTTITYNPYHPENVTGILSTGYLTDLQVPQGGQKDLLYPYISGVKGCCIKSYGSYVLTIQRNVPDLRVYDLSNASYIGNPLVADTDESVWHRYIDVSYNVFLLTGYVLSNLKVRRLNAEGSDGQGQGHVVFYNSYYSYYVVAPPSISIYGYSSTGANKVNIMSLPISGLTPTFFEAFDINQSNNYVNYNGANSSLTFNQPNPFYYAYYLSSNKKYNFQIESNLIQISLYPGGVGDFGSSSSPVVTNQTNQPYEILYDWQLINSLSDVSDFLKITVDSSLNYFIDYKQFINDTGSHYTTFNIFFSVGNPFVGPGQSNPGAPSYYLRLPSSQGTSVCFYQANIIYSDISSTGFEIGYYMVIDRYDTVSTTNYNEILQSPDIREVFFPVQTHYSKHILLGSIVDDSGNVIDQQDYLAEITLEDISGASWVQDMSFAMQYIGLTISALSNKGVDAIGDLLKYNFSSFLQSKVLYVKRQDAIRVVNALGNNVYRVTNSGNVQTQRILTSNVALYSLPNLPPVNAHIHGAGDIMSIYAQDTILNTLNPKM